MYSPDVLNSPESMIEYLKFHPILTRYVVPDSLEIIDPERRLLSGEPTQEYSKGINVDDWRGYFIRCDQNQLDENGRLRVQMRPNGSIAVSAFEPFQDIYGKQGKSFGLGTVIFTNSTLE